MMFLYLSVREKDWRCRVSDTRAASQAFKRMHNTLSHRVKTEVPGGSNNVSNKHWCCCKRGV